MWSISEHIQNPEETYDNDDQLIVVQFSVLDISREARNSEGVILTCDGGKHVIPLGGGVVRTSSAIMITPWGSHVPPGWMNKWLPKFYPHIIDQVYQSNILLTRLMKGPAPKSNKHSSRKGRKN